MVGAAPGDHGSAAAGPGAARCSGQGPGVGQAPGARNRGGLGGAALGDRAPGPRLLPAGSGPDGGGGGGATDAERGGAEGGRRRRRRGAVGGGAAPAPGAALPVARPGPCGSAVLWPGAPGREALGRGDSLLAGTGSCGVVPHGTADGCLVSASSHPCELRSKQSAVRGAETPLGPGSLGQRPQE